MSNQPTNENAPREVPLDYVLYANQQILMDRPSNLDYGEIGYDKLTPRVFIPPMEINLDGLTAGEFKTAVSNHLNIHCCYLPVWLIVEEAKEAGAIKFSGHGHEGFADFLIAARASSRMARLHVDLCMARPLPDEMAPTSPASDMEEDQLATSPPRPSLPTVATAANRIPPLDNNDLSMPDFLGFCKIPPANRNIWKLLKRHEIHHWTAFKDVSKLDLRYLGFAFGPVQLLHVGVLRYERTFNGSN
ncbi:hypothetical protein PCASD_00775 [Puccinia coronata f. sp. avenae]|uniref:Uncharacterized protein n=1 Tax=Puccinia coronata f. sp. avenae TaxID=200324 RepID=A0A2N5VL12_9BASI|nr:hypothetical protein PCASD_00775 [Puccinia coronata f. sp. avenae]